MQRQLEDEEDEEYELIDRFGSGRPYVCTAETKADLEANMYDRRKRVIFSQKMLKAMSLERTFWQNWRWKDGPRNGQVNGVSFNAESTETWEELQVAEDKTKAKQQPRRHRNNKRRAQKKLAAAAKTQQLRAELAGWGKIAELTSTKDGEEGVLAAWKGTRAAIKWWLRRGVVRAPPRCSNATGNMLWACELALHARRCMFLLTRLGMTSIPHQQTPALWLDRELGSTAARHAIADQLSLFIAHWDSHPAAKKLVELNSNLFIEVVNAIKGGYTMEQVESKYSVSANVKKEIAKVLARRN